MPLRIKTVRVGGPVPYSRDVIYEDESVIAQRVTGIATLNAEDFSAFSSRVTIVAPA
jgi:hypothetical protein